MVASERASEGANEDGQRDTRHAHIRTKSDQGTTAGGGNDQGSRGRKRGRPRGIDAGITCREANKTTLRVHCHLFAEAGRDWVKRFIRAWYCWAHLRALAPNMQNSGPLISTTARTVQDPFKIHYTTATTLDDLEPCNNSLSQRRIVTRGHVFDRAQQRREKCLK